MPEISRGRLVTVLGQGDDTREGLISPTDHSAFKQNGKLTVEDGDLPNIVLIKSSTAGSTDVALQSTSDLSVATDYDTNTVLIENTSTLDTVCERGNTTDKDITSTGTVTGNVLATTTGRITSAVAAGGTLFNLANTTPTFSSGTFLSLEPDRSIILDIDYLGTTNHRALGVPNIVLWNSSDAGTLDFLCDSNRYTHKLSGNPRATGDARFYLPVDEPAVESLLTMGPDGEIDYTATSTYLTAESDTLATVVARGAATHAGTDYSSFEADGTLVFNGAATVWDDLRITPGSFVRPGVSDPAYVPYYPNGGGLGCYLPEFAKNDFASFTVQMPHSYKQGSDISVHLHWTPGDRGNEENGALVGWKVDYSWANIDGTFTDMQTADLSDACDGTDHKHQMTPAVTITGTGKTISSMLLCNVRRSDTGTDDTWASTTSGQLPLLLEVDFHYEIDTVGSRSISSK